MGRPSEVLFLLALLLSAEVGVAPRLLQPADFADEFVFFLFLLVLNLARQLFIRRELGSTWHPTAPRAVTAKYQLLPGAAAGRRR